MIPRHLLITGMKWTVRVWKSVRYGGGECDGLCRVDRQDLLIAKHLHPDQARKTLLHEAIHATLYDNDNFHNEELVSLLTERLDSLLLDNPKFRALYDK